MTAPTALGPLQHPGPVARERLESVPSGTVTLRLALEPGRRLIDAIDDELARVGADSAQVELLGGPLSRVSYCVPALCTDGSRAAWYSDTHEAVTPVTLAGGSATVGRRDGERFMHCHAAWYDANGDLRGGHLWPDTVVGATPVEVALHVFDSAVLTSGVDDETLMPVFTPSPTTNVVVGNRRSVMTRVRPGVEIHEAVQKVMAECGFDEASVRGSLGSLVGATLLRDGGVELADGPATEVALAGHAVRGGEAHLSAFVMDRHGAVHVGELARRGNLVAVTFELLVEEIA
ncbi:PCC domain-containing protein [Rhodococcus triatomae]